MHIAVSAMAFNLPDRIMCTEKESQYQLILVMRDDKLPKDIKAIVLKKFEEIIYKSAAGTYVDPNGVLTFYEVPANLREVKLDIKRREATLLNFNIDHQFSCQF